MGARVGLNRDVQIRLARERAGPAEVHAADRVAAHCRLPVLPEEIVLAADRRWGRTLLEERDRKLQHDVRAQTASSERLSALRGQVMRKLYSELYAEIEEAVDRAVGAQTGDEP